MTKKIILELKKVLEKEKETIEKELKSFAKEDKNLKGDWDTRFPRLDGEERDSNLERAADEVEEYETLLPIEFNLEKKLQDVNLALKKIKTEKYGICETCKKAVSIERLKAFPSARTCKKCNK